MEEEEEKNAIMRSTGPTASNCLTIFHLSMAEVEERFRRLNKLGGIFSGRNFNPVYSCSNRMEIRWEKNDDI